MTGCIIGSVELTGCTRNSNSIWAFPGYHHWIVANPVKLKHPIYGVKGKLGLWTPDEAIASQLPLPQNQLQQLSLFN